MIHPVEYMFQTGEDVDLSIFLNMIARINESKKSKQISCECKCKFDCGKCN